MIRRRRVFRAYRVNRAGEVGFLVLIALLAIASFLAHEVVIGLCCASCCLAWLGTLADEANRRQRPRRDRVNGASR
jgi:hypothetical protein